MKFIPFTEDMFHLPYKNLDEVKKDFRNVSLDKVESSYVLFACVEIGKVEYCIFTDGESPDDTIKKFNEMLESYYIPKFRAKYSI